MKKILLLIFAIFSFFLSFAQQNPQEKLAIQYYQEGEFEKAREIFKPIYDKKKNSYIYVYYYHTLLQLGDYKELEKIAKDQVKKYPTVQRYVIDLAYVYEMSGNSTKAIKEYDEALDKLPNNENSYRELYNAFLSKAKRDYAILTLKRGRKKLNNPKLFSNELTKIYTQLKLYTEVIEETLNLISDDDAQYLATAEQNLQSLLMDDEDKQNYYSIKRKLQEAIQKSPSNNCYLSLLYWVYQYNKDYADAFVLSKAIDKRRADDGMVIYDLARIMIANREYTIAIDALNYVIDKGEKSSYFVSSKFLLLDVKYQLLISTSPIDEVAAESLEKEFKNLLNENGVHSGTADWIRKYAHLLAFYVNKANEAETLLKEAIKNSERDVREQAIYKIDLADVMLYEGNIWDATLLYSQVNKDLPNDTIGHIAKFKNAKLSFYIGEFAWAKSQLDVLRAATSKLIANDAMYLSFIIADNEDVEEEEEEDEEELFDDTSEKNISLKYFSKADFMIFQNNDKKALEYLDSVLVVEPYGKMNDDVYFQKAKILIRQKDYFTAETFLKKIVESYNTDILADDATFLLAELYEYYLKNIPQAMEMYKKLLKDHSNSIYAVEARKQFRALRGDELQ